MVYAMITKKIPITEDGSRLDRCIRRLLGNINQAILEKLLRSSKILLDEEKTKNLDNIESCFLFKKNCEDSKIKLNDTINKLIAGGKRIVGYAATSKSTTILNYCGIGPEMIDYICDTTKEKIGKYSPGMHIPIVSVDHFRKDNADIAYLFAWNHKTEIFAKEELFIKNNGKWISHVEI